MSPTFLKVKQNTETGSGTKSYCQINGLHSWTESDNFTVQIKLSELAKSPSIIIFSFVSVYLGLHFIQTIPEFNSWPTGLTEVICGFCHFLRKNAGIVPSNKL
jgi:hypothetical protein